MMQLLYRIILTYNLIRMTLKWVEILILNLSYLINFCVVYIQVSHWNKKLELYQTEIEEKDKVLHILCEKFHNYFLLLRGHGHVTEKMSNSYRKLVKTMQGIRNVTFQDLENKDSGCSVGATSCKFFFILIYKHSVMFNLKKKFIFTRVCVVIIQSIYDNK